MSAAAAPPTPPALSLAFGLTFEQLYDPAGLVQLDASWLGVLTEEDPDLAQRLIQARAHPERLSAADEAALLIELGPALEHFVGQLFGIAPALAALTQAHAQLAPLLQVKWKFVRRQAVLGVSAERLAALDLAALQTRLQHALQAQGVSAAAADLSAATFDEAAFAQAVVLWQAQATTSAGPLDDALLYSAWAAGTPAGQARHRAGVLFCLPQAVRPEALLDESSLQRRQEAGVTVLEVVPAQLRRRLSPERPPFALTDAGPTRALALDAARYCLRCHPQGKDSCAKGLRAPGPASSGPIMVQSAQGLPLAGCPLEERISEFLTLKSQGLTVAALAMITLDNPMVAATGHRICNDCLKSCIFQQQTPVNVPSAETQTLQDVLSLPWGFEIYALLTRWNPLNIRRPVPAPASGYRVLVVGTGPAGFTLAHHLLNDGHAVLAVDGLKIEPLPPHWTGQGPLGERYPLAPIHNVQALHEDLDQRVAGGFGGVAEYGITARWDKNFLTLIRLLLQRRPGYSVLGGVRLGSTLTVADAWALGFDHVALAVGAGRPAVLDLPHGLARGVRTASDFLMSLQQSGAARTDALVNLQIRLPVLVVGGGLTAIDAATEALAYYPVQVEKFCARYEALVAQQGVTAVRAHWSAEDAAMADEFIGHAQALRAEAAAAVAQQRPARLTELLQSWGGVTVVYRKALSDSPAYARNHDELQHALHEGIGLIESLTPAQFTLDASGAVQAIICTPTLPASQTAHSSITLAARTVLLALGTAPNTEWAHEDPALHALAGACFQVMDEHGAFIPPTDGRAKPKEAAVLIAGSPGQRWVSCLGDAHPGWGGSVVKAMASAQRGWPVIARALRQRPPSKGPPDAAWRRHIHEQLSARIVRVTRLAPKILEVVVHAPLAARHFQPGQFYRLQTFEHEAPRVAPFGGPSTRLAPEALALTGAWVDRRAGWVATIVLEMGGSTLLCAALQTGQDVVLMGPTGAPTTVPSQETVVLIGGGLGNAVLFSIGSALRAAGSKVIYFAGYRTPADRFKHEAIEAAADVVIWCCEEGPVWLPTRPQDRSLVGNVLEAMLAWAQGHPLLDAQGCADTGPRAYSLATADRLMVIGSDRLMAAVARARHQDLAPYLNPNHQAWGSINSPMQCMMKGICGQCLQTHLDPVTGRTHYVFSCIQQDQPLDWVDFAVLDARLKQNALQEKLTTDWVRACLSLAHLPSA